MVTSHRSRNGCRPAVPRGIALALTALALATCPSSVAAATRTPLRDAPPAGPAVTAAAARTSLPYNGTIKGVDAPWAVAVNRYSRKIYVTELGRNQVAVFNRLGEPRGALGQGVLIRPTALAFDFLGNLAVLSASRQIALFRPNGSLLARGPVPAVQPVGLAFNPSGRQLLITDRATNSVWISRDGRTWTQEKPPGLFAPVGADAAHGRFFVVSSGNGRLFELGPDGKLIRTRPLNGAQGPLGVTFPPFGNGLVVSSVRNHQGLFASRIGRRFTAFGARRMTAPVLPGSECTRVAFADFAGDRVVAFDLPNAASCAQGVGLRRAETSRDFRRIAATIVAEHDSRLSLGAVVRVPGPTGRVKRYRLRGARTTLMADTEKRLRLRIPRRAAIGIRGALRRRQRSVVKLTFVVRNTAGDRRRAGGQLVFRSRSLRRTAGAATTGVVVER